MKKFLLSLVIILLSILSYNLNSQTLVSTDPQPRNVVLEEFTGIYCGYCPYGHEIGQAIHDKNPGRVVLINIHSGSYAIPQDGSGHPDFRTPYGELIDDMSGLGGYPAAQVNRQLFHGYKYAQQDTVKNTMALSRNGWETAANEILNDANSPVNIGASVIRNGADSLEITVELYYTANAGQNNKLNVVLLESGYIGYQGGSKGGENYVHNHIMRDMITGQWGEVINTTTQGTLVTKNYKYKITDRVNSVGSSLQLAFFVTNADNKTILTGNETIIPMIPPTATLSSTGSLLEVKPIGNSFSKDFILKNISEEEISFEITIEKSARTPLDWSVGITDPAINLISLSSGDSVVIKAQITPGTTLGFGDAILNIRETNTENLLLYSSQITCISQEIQKFHVLCKGEDKYSMIPELEKAGYSEFFNISADDYTKYQNLFQNSNFVIWNSGAKGTFNNAQVNSILADVDAGKKLFVCGNLSASYINSYNGLGKFGLEYLGTSTQGYGYSPWRVWFSGFGGDPISSDFGKKTEGSLIDYLIILLKIKDEENVKPFLRMAYDGKITVPNGNQRDTFNVTGKESYFGVRVRHENSRSVILSLCPNVIVDANKRQKIINNIIKWLNNTGPELDLNYSTLDFGFLITNQEKILPVVMFNPGNEVLNVTEISISGRDSYSFSLENNNEIPFTIEPGEYKNFLVKFKPIVEQDYEANLNIISNGSMNPNVKLDITGSSALTYVPELISKNKLFKLYPNPSSGESKMIFDSEMQINNDIQISIYGITGNKLHDISATFNKFNEFNINLSDLVTGTYYVAANINGKHYVEPIVIIK